MNTIVHLLRHGEVHNPQGILYGRSTGFHLSERGHAMADRIADRIGNRDITHVIASPLERAQETAAPLAAALGLSVEIDERIVESSNVFEGKRFDIRDSMCGFRVYPLAPVLKLIDEETVGRRMDFDPEIIVRLHWRGIGVHNLATPVRYPTDGVSHFDVWRDNVRISRMHTRLFFGMIARLPRRLFGASA